MAIWRSTPTATTCVSSSHAARASIVKHLQATALAYPALLVDPQSLLSVCSGLGSSRVASPIQVLTLPPRSLQALCPVSSAMPLPPVALVEPVASKPRPRYHPTTASGVFARAFSPTGYPGISSNPVGPNYHISLSILYILAILRTTAWANFSSASSSQMFRAKLAMRAT